MPPPDQLDLELVREQMLGQTLHNERRWTLAWRWHLVLTTAWVGLAVALIAISMYALPVLRGHAVSLAHTANLQSTVDALTGKMSLIGLVTDHMKDNDTLITALLSDQLDQRSQIQALNRQFHSKDNNKAPAAPAPASSDAIDALRARVAALEARRDADQQRITDLRQELSQVRARLDNEARATPEPRPQPVVAASAPPAAPSDEHLVSANPESIGFLIAKGHRIELAPGISIGLTTTDTSHNRADGWIWVMPERRTILISGQTVQTPFTFYASPGDTKCELVITKVSRNSIAGYLLLPKRTISERETLSASALAH